MPGRRVHERYECDFPVNTDVDGAEVAFVATNISLGGMFCTTDVKIAYGTELKVRFRLPALKEDTTCPMTVRWLKPDGIGLQFGSLRALEVWALNQFFKTLEPAAPDEV